MNLQRENGKAWQSAKYEWKSGAVTKTGTTPTDSLADEATFDGLFDDVPRAHHIRIEADAAAYFKLVGDGFTGDIITVTATTPYEDHYCVVEDILVATNNAAVTITVKLR